jgi:hypothetical protein
MRMSDRPEEALGVDHQLEPAAGARATLPAAQKLGRRESDAGVFDDLVDQAGDGARHDAGINAGLAASDPGDARFGKSLAQSAHERQLQERIADAVEANVDKNAGNGRRLFHGGQVIGTGCPGFVLESPTSRQKETAEIDKIAPSGRLPRRCRSCGRIR